MLSAWFCARRGNYIIPVGIKKEKKKNEQLLKILGEYYACDHELKLACLEDTKIESILNMSRRKETRIVACTEIEENLFSNQNYALIFPLLPLSEKEIWCKFTLKTEPRH